MERPLTGHIRPGQGALSLKEYEKVGGYSALRKARSTMTPAEVVAMVTDAGLRGRGGAGFPTGKKWSFVPMGDDAPRPKYVVANGDEMEPGTFKDRLLLEHNPHQLIEGLLLAAYAIQADHAYIFLRWAYREAAVRVAQAIEEARGAGYLGEGGTGSSAGVTVRLHISAGRYICGEETALLNAIEGRRAVPRAKPPFPPIAGLFGRPTVVQNVETLCSVPPIIANGAAWYHDLGRTDDAGTKLFGVSGKAKRPGIFELPMGTPIREIIEEHAGGLQDGLTLRGLLPGGASTDFIPASKIDTPMDFAHVQALGSRLGTGTMILLDDQTCPVGMVHNLSRFFAQESCGWCTPCRDGLPWVTRTLQAIENGEGQARDLEILAMHGTLLGSGNTFCALAPGAMEPLQSALRIFRSDFERHIRDKKCPWRHA